MTINDLIEDLKFWKEQYCNGEDVEISLGVYTVYGH
jgi:hypothetical protein